MKKLTALISFSLLTIISLSRAEDTKASKRTIHIGFSGVLSGPWAAYGTNAKNGILLASENLSNEYQFDFQDDGCDPKNSRTNAERFLTNRNTDAIIVLCMEALESAALVGKRRNMPVFSTGYISQDILKRFDNVFPIYTLADTDVRYIVPYINKQNSIKTLGLIHQETNIGEIVSKSFDKESKESHFKLILKEAVSGNNFDYNALALRVLKRNPDGVFLQIDDDNIAQFIKELRRIGYKGQVYSWFTFESENTRKDQSPLLDNVIYPFPVGGDENSVENRQFFKAFVEKFNYEPPTYSKITYDGMKIIDKLISQCPDISIKCISEAYGKLGEYVGIAGRVTLTKEREAIRESAIKIYKNGEFKWMDR